MEQQATMPVEMFERLVESLLQNLTSINKLGGVTVSPSRKKKAVDNLRKASGIPMQLDAESGAFVPVFIFGDFNLHHPLWGSDKSSPLSNDFVEWLQNSSFVLLNSSNPTYATHTGSASRLDLSICSASISHGVDCYVSDSNFESDHCPVIITWSKLKHISKKIKTIDWNRTMSQSANVLTTKTNLNVLTRKISEVIRDNTKIITLPANDYPPWWNLSCHNFHKLKILFRKRSLRLISESDWIKHKKYVAKLRFHIKKASRNYWDKICNITRNPPLKAHNNLSWIDTLPTVLLGLRTAIQEDNNYSIAQIVYGERLRLPGEFSSEPSIRTALEGFANNLQKQMETVGPRTTRRNSRRHIFVHKDLENCSHVFQRIDRVKKQLESPYEGPFPVIERQDKYY
ncbi:hypothetical protein AVEN_214603-2 [Araneus ventricosus]|uniref:Endonuclease/exonuclease/phosphatase domain-containing protein n=1 Tax=Araneus ventricosus TaxID=182803 RepID=A0A4Y2IC89_ARAVE|nr:hypothetical protein AVEN_214603-2 [Araneus ventricosus]